MELSALLRREARKFSEQLRESALSETIASQRGEGLATSFQKRYRDDPAGFVQNCFSFPPHETPALYQLEILTSLERHHRVSARGPHGIGKSALAAWAILWFALTRDGWIDWKVPVTASVWRQVKDYLFPEVHKWAKRIIWEKVDRAPFRDDDELQVLGLKLTTGQVFGVVSDEPSAVEGAHASELLYVLDEAKAIPNGIWEAVEGALSSGNCYALSLSTPGVATGVFYNIQKRKPGYEDWTVRHVTSDEAIAAGRMSPTWRGERKKTWGVKSPVYLNRVEGEFAEGGTDKLIQLSWVEAANDRFLDLPTWEGQVDQVGVDVARYGEDQTCIALRRGNAIRELRYSSQQDTMATVGLVILAVKGDKTTPICVDVLNMGAGVVDRLREQGYSVYGVNVSEKAVDRNGVPLTDHSGELAFVNLRSYLWWLLRERLDPELDEPMALVEDDLFIGDLTEPTWTPTSAGKIQVESKDDIRNRLGRSTDSADGTALALLPVDLFYRVRTILF